MDKLLDDVWKIVKSTCVISNDIHGDTSIPEKYFKEALERYIEQTKLLSK